MKTIVTGMINIRQWIILFSLILGLGVTSCENREPGIIAITGEIKGLPEGRVRLYTYPPSNLLLNSCEIREGKYKLKGKLDDPQLGMLFFDVKPEYQPDFMPMVRLFLQPARMKVYSEREDMKGSLKVENAPLHEWLVACEQFLKSLPEYERATVLTICFLNLIIHRHLLNLHTLKWGTQVFSGMFVKKKKNRSRTVSVVVAEKISGRYSELTTIGVSSDESVIGQLVIKGKEWIAR